VGSIVIPGYIYTVLKRTNMTVKELITHLQQFNPETPIVIQHIDHTDWNYTWDLESEGVYEDEDVYDEDGELEYPKAIVINGTPW
jgi:hypothetical protein